MSIWKQVKAVDNCYLERIAKLNKELMGGLLQIEPPIKRFGNTKTTY